jgi:hypothetical protein
MKRYLDFDLLFRRIEGGFRAQVVNSPAGQASSDFVVPFSDLELENLLLRLGRPRRTTRRVASSELAAVKTFGGRLFSAAFGADVLVCFRMSLEQALAKDLGLRIRLRLSEVPELADLPWEYLYNPSVNQFLSLSVATPVVRFLDLSERIQSLRVDLPIRVLVMVANPHDYPALDVQAEWNRLERALADLKAGGKVVLERLPDAKLSTLQRRLRLDSCHVFHFIGHGGFSEQADDGFLVLEGESGRGNVVSGNYLGTLLHDHRPLRMAVLNACEGARSGRVDPFAGAAQSLVQQGVPAVIAMQFEITDQAAITFAHELYFAIADGCAVDTALVEGRKALFSQGNEVEWGTPVLYMRTSDGQIFDVVESSRDQPIAESSVQNRSTTTPQPASEGTSLQSSSQDPEHADLGPATKRPFVARSPRELLVDGLLPGASTATKIIAVIVLSLGVFSALIWYLVAEHVNGSDPRGRHGKSVAGDEVTVTPSLPLDAESSGTGEARLVLEPQASPLLANLTGNATAHISPGGWMEVQLFVNDAIEPCNQNRVYKNRTNENVLTAQASCAVEIVPGTSYSFKVRAPNYNADAHSTKISVKYIALLLRPQKTRGAKS